MVQHRLVAYDDTAISGTARRNTPRAAGIQVYVVLLNSKKCFCHEVLLYAARGT